MNSLYFVAINTPDLVSQDVREIQYEFADSYDSKRQLRIPVHITLIPPFKMVDEQMAVLRASLRRFCISHQGFPVQLKDFGAFGNRTIYIDVAPSNELQGLHADLHHWLENDIQFIPPIKHPVFRPHVTVANRDLKADKFHLAWNRFKDKSFIAEFNVDQIVVLKHNGKVWEVLEEVPFAQ